MHHPLIEPLESRIAPASTLGITQTVSHPEGNTGTTAFVFTVTLSEAPAANVTVDFATADGTAIAGSDYAAQSGTLTFAVGGPLTQTITVLGTGDILSEADETFTVTLSNPTAGTTITDATGTGTIQNDPRIVLTKSDDVFEGDSGTQTITFTATLTDGPTTHDVVANRIIQEITGGATVSDQDYVAVPAGAFIFSPGGPTSLTLPVTIIGDTKQELDESFDLRITTITDGTAAFSVPVDGNNLRATIKTDLLRVTQLTTTVLEGASGQSLVTYEIRPGDYEGGFPVTVGYSTDVNGSAVAGSDFASTTGSLTFTDATPQTVSVAIYGDTVAEASETFIFRAKFASPGGGVPDFTRDTVTTIVNDDVSVSIADNAQTSSVTQGLAELNSGTHEMTFVVTLAGAITAPVTVNYATVSGSGVRGAVAGSDFVAKSDTLTFTPGGPVTQTISITINGDTAVEVSESFTVALSGLSAPGMTTSITDASGLGTIKNDDSSVSLTSLGPVAEGQSGTRTMGFRATLSAALPDATTFTYSTADGAVNPLTLPTGTEAATVANNDYVAVTNGTITIPAGQTFVDFFVTVRGDTAIEKDEVFTVTLPSNVPDTVIGARSVLGTIQNDDPALSISDVTLSEGAPGGTGTATFVVTLSQAPAAGETVTVKYSTGDGTATSVGATADFTAVTAQTLTFTAGETQKTITINVSGDNRFENAETFTVTLSDAKLVRTSGETALTLARPTGTATIADDDRPTVSIAPTARVAENAGAATFNVTLSNPSDVEIRVDYRTQDGTALAGSDYTALALSTLVFTPGLTQNSVSVFATPDGTNEPDETFQVLLSNARIVNPAPGVSPALTLGTATGIGTIANDDRTVTIGNATLVEEAAAMTFTVTLSAPSDTFPVTVFFSTREGSTNPATSGADYTATSGSIVIPANSTTGTIAIPIREDATDEEDQTFEVVLSSATNAVIAGNGIGTGTITDDDAAPVVQMTPSVVVTEGSIANGLNFTVTLSTPSEKEVKVNYATASGTATAGSDFTATSGTLTIPAGQGFGSFNVPFQGDTIAEADETFTATISAPVNATLGATVTSTATLLNDDVAPSLSIADVSAREGAGSFTFTVTLSRAYGLPVTVQFATADGSALAGSDYTSTAGSLTFAANETSKTIVVPIANNDAVAEPDERFLVRLTAPTNAVLADAEATGFIQNDDVAFTVQDLTVTEEGGGNTPRSALVTVTRTGTAAAAVQFRTVDGTALSTNGRDFTATAGTLSFAAGELSKTISVPIAVDAAYEFDEQFTVELFSPVNAVIDDATATVTIADNDAAPTLSVSAASAAEGANSNRVTFTVLLSAPNEREDVTLQFETIDGTAVSTLGNADFSPPTGGVGEVRFTRGTTSQAVQITTINDTRDENDETFTLRLKNANAAFAGGGATLETTGTILDNDAAPSVALTGGLTIGEGESGVATRVFTARLSSASDKTVTVNWRTLASVTGAAATPGVDFTAVAGGVLTFAPNVTEQTFSVAIADDALDEVDEVFDVTIETPVNATLGAVTRATATITDDDAAPVIVIGDSSIVEGAAPAIVFTVSLTAASGRTVAVNYSTGATGDTATASGPFKDYDAVSGATLTFAPGETSKTISIPIIDDVFREEVAVVANNDFTLEGERFTLTLATPSNATLGAATAQGLILNGNDATLGLALSNSGAAEGALNGQTALVFNIVLSAPAVDPVTFNVATRNGTAVAGVDFAAIANAVTIAGESTTTDEDNVTTRNPGATSTTVTVNSIGDNAFETAEFFFLDASGFAGGVVAVNASAEGVVTGRGIIYNDDFNLLNNGRTLQWTDVDGDLVTMTTTRGSFAAVPTATYSTTDTNGAAVERRWLQPTGDFGGSQLALLSLINLGGFAGAAISISAEPQVGFFEERSISDGLVHVGEIRAAQRVASGELDWVGIDLHSVTVEGDLAKIVAGDNVSTTALRRLDVQSLGRFANAPGGANDRGSEVLGPIGTVHVRGDLIGQLKLIGQEFGRIGALTIDGALRGGAIDNTGQVLVSGHVGRATIGEIVGGAGANSGALIGNLNNSATLGSVTVLGAIAGGSGRLSGTIQALQIGHVKTGSLTGGAGINSGLVFANGGNIASLTVEGGIAGGAGESSGQVFAAGAIGHIKAESLTGGAGASSGLIRANAGAISSVTFTGSLTGGAGDNSGQIFAQTSIGHVKLGGIAGGAGDASGVIGITKTANQDTSGNPIFGTSGSVRSLTVAGSIVGGGGDFSGMVAAARSVGPVQVGADVVGGAGGASGQVFSVGTLGRVTIGDDVLGGAGTESGAVKAGILTEVRIAGDVIGGAGLEAGSVEGGSVSLLTIGGVVAGGAGADSGSVRIGGDATKITVGENTAGQSVLGGAGVRSGRIAVGDDLRQIVLAGDIAGGAGSFSGGLVVTGDLFSATLRGGIDGGDAPATGAPVVNSGFLQAGVLHAATIAGSITAGVDAGAGLSNSGVIRTNRIVALTIDGSVTGTAATPAIISASAGGDASDLGIGSLLIKGSATFAEILAGYGGSTTTSFRGQLVSADAQISKVEIRGLAQGVNIVAGAAPGADGRFGDATDALASGTGVRDSDRAISSIASVILRGGASANAASFGIVAQHVVSVRTGAALTPLAGLARGAGNDLGATDASDLIAVNFRALEVVV